MKHLLAFFLIITASNLYSQDIILKKSGESIESKILEIGIDNIKYNKFNNLSGPTYIIAKNDVSKITFENGGIEVFANKNISDINEVKKTIVDLINEFGYEGNSFKRNYSAFFYDDYLWLKVLKSNKYDSKYSRDQLKYDEIYDFSTVFKFDGVSKREDQLAFVNIYVSKLISEKKDFVKGENKNKWTKNKLVIRVKGYKNADKIMNAFREYNRLLNEKL